jgi:4-amino-4-deoxy-L-arabinose transferase-like glycosyltransferase
LILALFAPVAAAYLRRLGDAPVYLIHDEVIFGLNAHSIATTLHDLNGRLLPLYIQVRDLFWATPINIYLTAAFLRFLPMSETAIRLPSALLGLSDIVLMFFVALRIFERERPAILAAGLLALTPAHFIHSRLGVDHLYPVPFVLAWLYCLLIFQQRHSLRVLFAATSLLGIGVYTYLASFVMMPMYFALTCLVIALTGERSPRPYLLAALGFVWPLVPLVPWLISHPAQYSQEVHLYRLYDPSTLNPLQGVKEVLSYTGLTERVSVFYDFFNPSFLFFSGDASLVHTTRRVGVFLLPLAALLPVGIVAAVRQRHRAASMVALLGFLTAPLAAAAVAEYYRINRALVMLPFACLLGTWGVEQLLASRQRLWRFAAVGLIVLVPVQFMAFYRDYLTDYRVRASGWFEGNIRGAVEQMIAQDGTQHVPAFYLADDIQWADYYWRLYAIKNRRDDLIGRAVVFEPKTVDMRMLAPGTLLLVRCVAQPCGVEGAPETSLIREPGGSLSFAILQRPRALTH